MDRPPGSDHHRPVLIVRQPLHFFPRRFSRDPRKAMVESIRFDRRARVCDRTQPEPTKEARRGRFLVFGCCLRIAPIDVTGLAAPHGLRSLQIPVGHRHHRRSSADRYDFVRCSPLPVHCYCRGYFRQLPVSDPCRIHPSPCPRLASQRIYSNLQTLKRV